MLGPLLARSFDSRCQGPMRLLRRRIQSEKRYAEESQTETQNEKEPAREKAQE
jgi:hypothetical protein